MKRKQTWLYILLIIAILSSLVVAVGLGAVKVAPTSTISIFAKKLFDMELGYGFTRVEENIIWNLRLPRVLLGLIVGSSLSIAGVCMQALVKNELADPFILGVSSGASAFATLGMIFGSFTFLGTYSLSLSAFWGAFFSMCCVYMLSKKHRKIVLSHLLLIGVVVGMIFDSLTRIIILSAPNALGLHNASFWMSGSLANAKWAYLGFPSLLMLCCLALLLPHYRTLNLLLFGEETAHQLGVNVGRFQKILIVLASLLTGICISVSGTIGFVGMVCPHFTRLLVGSDHRRVLPVSAMLGGLLVIWTDVIARTIIAPEELPIGILTAVLGGPFFIILLKKGGWR